MNIVLFEDEHVGTLFPAAIARPAYAVTCGAKRLIDWVTRLDGEVHGWVRPHLREIQELDYPAINAWNGKIETDTLFVNARLVPSKTNFNLLHEIVSRQQYGKVNQNQGVAVAFLPAGTNLDASSATYTLSSNYFSQTEISELDLLGRTLELIEYPHDIVRHNLTIIDENLTDILQNKSFEEVKDGVFMNQSARLGEHLVFDTTDGPIVIDESAAIGSYTYLKGPIYIGPRAKVIEHSAIKDAVSLGHTTKIGGEVEASIIEPFTNKQHHGFLGHSYLGSWINLGAGTCNSDLKNTYGEVKMEYANRKVSSQMQFLGCIMGDYSKTAINTGIFTGKVIGLASMLYGFVTTNVPSFVNYARFFGQVTEMPPEVMVATQKRMFDRRNVVQRPCDIQLIHDLFELTRHERQLAGEPLSL